MVLMLAISISLAAGPQGIHEPGTGLANTETKEAAQGTGQGLNTVNGANVSSSTPGIHEPGTGITNPEVKEAAQSAKETGTSAPKTQSGFDVVFALTGFIMVAFIALRRRN
jgi:hypothetical protein